MAFSVMVWLFPTDYNPCRKNICKGKWVSRRLSVCQDHESRFDSDQQKMPFPKSTLTEVNQ